MGIRYVLFRALYELKRKTGLIKNSFPTEIPNRTVIELNSWKNSNVQFFFRSREDIEKIKLTAKTIEELEEYFNIIKSGGLKLFSGNVVNDAFSNWFTNPENNFVFDKKQHWTKIDEFAKGHGDIKYIWEKGRFCYLYTIIRYDHQFGADNSELVFNLIVSWIDNNQLNCGPYFKCSQEIALRICNWIFALYYYKNSNVLTQAVFQKIIDSIYAQSLHIESNLKFAAIAVRNNHIISEALGLFTVGILFPWFPQSKKWIEIGKRYLEREGIYQIYEDGSYIQHSFNYHRLIIQLYTWALQLGKVNNIYFNKKLVDRLKKTVHFIISFTQSDNGKIPNYGANDGSLIFPLNSCDYTDYRPQAGALYALLMLNSPYTHGLWDEDLNWFGLKKGELVTDKIKTQSFYKYENGGYYILKSDESMCFIRCSKYRHRPVHADNLHVDIWYKGKNIICDRGTFSYNTDPDTMKEFYGTLGHNTISVDFNDQMLKGPRFIWYFWSQAKYADISQNSDYVMFEGMINAFRHLKKNGIKHKRTVKQYSNSTVWEISDNVENWEGTIIQSWNIDKSFIDEGFTIRSFDKYGQLIEPTIVDGYYSKIYGMKSGIQQIRFIAGNTIITKIVKT